jgi:5'-3' exonuclease
MGIPNLNRYLQTNCAESIQRVELADLSGKRIAIDVSIYLYRFEADNALLENMYLMLAIFAHYNITPIFIFDGKAPPEKKALLIKRKEAREQAQEDYDAFNKELDESSDADKKQELVNKMEKLKPQMVQITGDKIRTVKKLITAFGETYCDAPGEADEMCAQLVINDDAWACLSEDMDLFVYGATRVLRYFSLIAHTAVLYNTCDILSDLKMTQTEFREVCVLSGTDYNTVQDNSVVSVIVKAKKLKLTQTIKYFYKFKQDTDIHSNNYSFYEWLLKNTKFIENTDALYKIIGMFQLTDSKNEYKTNILTKQIITNEKDQSAIEAIMAAADFIFVPK